MQASAAENGNGASGGVILRSIAANGECAVLVAECTRLVAQAQHMHETSPTATAALGRAMVGGLLLGAFKGDKETVQLTWRGDGPLGQRACGCSARLLRAMPLTPRHTVLVIADSTGYVKGTVSNRLADPPLRPDKKLNVGAAVGEGVLSVVRAHPDMKEPYTGEAVLHGAGVSGSLLTC